MNKDALVIIFAVGLVLLIMVIRFVITSAVNKGAQAIENAAARGSNARNGPEVVALRDLYPELAAQVLAQNGGVAPVAAAAAGMICSSCGAPGEGNFCNECGAPMIRPVVPSAIPSAAPFYQPTAQSIIQTNARVHKPGSGIVVYVFTIIIALFGILLTVNNIRPTIIRIDELERSMEVHTLETDPGWYALDKIEHDMLLGTYPIMIAAGVGYILMCVSRKRIFALAVPVTSAVMLILFVLSDMEYLRAKELLMPGLAILCITCVVTLLYLIFDKLPVGFIMLLLSFTAAFLINIGMQRCNMDGLMYLHTAGNAFLMFMLSIANKRRKRYREYTASQSEEQT